MLSAYERFLAFRHSLPRTPRLERQTVRVRGVALAVFTSPPAGDATPLLCINGGLLYDHSMLWPALSPLAATRQVVLYDQRGRGASEAPVDPADASIEDDAADVGALRRSLGIPQWDVLGHSWGGGIALLAAAADPSGTRRVITVDAVGPTSDWMPVLRRNVLARLTGPEHDAVANIPEEALAQPDPELHSRYARAVYPAWFADPDMARHFVPPRAISETGATVLARLRREHYDWRAPLRVLTAPTLVIHGADDALPPAISADIDSLLQDSRRTLLPGSGHMPFWEAPERFFPQVTAFLDAPTLLPVG